LDFTLAVAVEAQEATSMLVMAESVAVLKEQT
jgi:hypothetical protein